MGEPIKALVCIVGGTMYGSTDPGAQKTELPPKSEVTIKGYSDPFFLVQYGKKTGFVEYSFIEETPKGNELIEAQEAIKAEKFSGELENHRKAEEKANRLELERIAAENRKLDEKRLIQLETKYGRSDGALIFNGRIWLGMTDEMARDSLGYPDDINRSVTKFGVSEQWIYRNRDRYLYFENGILESWQD